MQEIGSVLYFLILYFLLMVLIPVKVLRLPVGKGQKADSIVKGLLVSNTVCISWVYGLGLLHIYNRYTLIIGLILTAVVYGWIKKVSYREAAMNAIHVLALIGGGQYRVEIFAKDWLRKKRAVFLAWVKDFFKNLTVGKVVYFLLCLLIFGIMMQRRLYAFFGTYAYRTSDMYVHTEWINYMETGNIFSDGIYPFGMHNILSALHLISGLHINQIVRYYGALNCFLTVLMAVYFLCRVGKTKASVLIYLVLYGITDFVGNVYVYRMAFTLPQECGMPFLFVSVLLLGKFLESKKKEDAVYFSLAASLTLSMHFFTVIFAVALCGSLVLVYIRRIWKEKLILPLCKCLLLIVCISILPFLGGMLEGKNWQGSMSWALGVMKTDNTSAQETEEEKDDEKDTTSIELSGESEAVPEAEISQEEKKSLKDICSMFLYMMVEKMYAFWGYVFWAGMVFAAVYFLLGRRQWKTWQNKQLFAVWLTLLFCVILMGYWILGLPQLMKEERVRMFIGYFGPALFAIPVEGLAAYFGKWGRRFAEVVGLGAAVLCFYVTYGLGNLPFQTYFYLQTSTAAEACVKISEEYPQNTWTIVSPVEELSLIRGLGYHYELWEFIANMEQYTPDRYFEIPTKHIFFVLEKKPLPYNVTRIMGQEYEDEPIKAEEADTVVTKEMLGISEYGSMKYYNIYENRRALEAKLAAWIKVYSEMFPDQMSVYMDSDDCIVYKFEQNEYALNNLAIDYGYNVISDEDYDRMLIQKQREREEMEEER